MKTNNPKMIAPALARAEAARLRADGDGPLAERCGAWAERLEERANGAEGGRMTPRAEALNRAMRQHEAAACGLRAKAARCRAYGQMAAAAAIERAAARHDREADRLSLAAAAELAGEAAR